MNKNEQDSGNFEFTKTWGYKFDSMYYKLLDELDIAILGCLDEQKLLTYHLKEVKQHLKDLRDILDDHFDVTEKGTT